VHFKGKVKKILFAIDFQPIRYWLKTAAQGGGAIYERSEAVKNQRQKNFFTCPFK
jgi:hypothetical protein